MLASVYPKLRSVNCCFKSFPSVFRRVTRSLARESPGGSVVDTTIPFSKAYDLKGTLEYPSDSSPICKSALFDQSHGQTETHLIFIKKTHFVVQITNVDSLQTLRFVLLCGERADGTADSLKQVDGMKKGFSIYKADPVFSPRSGTFGSATIPSGTG